MALTVYDIVKGINQAAANSWDGGWDENYEKVLVGLKREEGDPILDKRVMDGFKVALQGPLMRLTYQTELKLKEVYQTKFEEDITARIEDIVKFIKKEYKKLTKESLNLDPVMKEPHIKVDYISNVRAYAIAHQIFKVTELEDKMSDPGKSAEEKFEDAMKSWLEQTKKK